MNDTDEARVEAVQRVVFEGMVGPLDRAKLDSRDSLPWKCARDTAEAVLVTLSGNPQPVHVTTVEELEKYPDGSVFLNSRGHVAILDTVEFAPEDPARVWFSVGSEEDWPIDRLGFPARLLHRPVAVGGDA